MYTKQTNKQIKTNMRKLLVNKYIVPVRNVLPCQYKLLYKLDKNLDDGKWHI